MKKTIAAVGATVLGLVAASAAAAVPASAATTTTPACTTGAAASTSASDPATASYFQDCVPQYGVGKVEYTLTADQDLSDFNLGSVETAYSDLAPTALSKYFSSSNSGTPLASRLAQAANVSAKSAGKGIQSLGDGTSNPNIYWSSTGSFMALKIATVQKLTKASLSSKCQTATKHYDAVYRYTYAPVNVTFQTSADDNLLVDGQPGSFHMEKAFPSLTVGVNFKEGVTDSTDSWDHLNQGAPQCAVFNGQVAYAPKYAAEDEGVWADAAYSAIDGVPSFSSLNAGTSALQAGLTTPAVIAQVSGHAGVDASVIATVKAGSVYQDGVVTVTVDGKRLKTEGQLTGGKLKLTLPHSLKAGSHAVTIAFPGGPGALPNTIEKSITVAK